MSARTIVVGDVHGEAGLFSALLDELALAPGDQLVLLGDLIDHGRGVRAVLDRVTALAQETTVACIRGNHEAMLLAAREDPCCLSWLENGGLQTIAAYAPDVAEACKPLMDGLFAHRESFPVERFFDVFPESHLRFIAETSMWVRYGEFFLCHAGVDPTVGEPERSRARVFLEGHPGFPHDYEGSEVIVFGHHFSGDMRGDGKSLPFLSSRGNAIGIDTGSFRSGVLAALVLEEEQIYVAEKGCVLSLALEACEAIPSAYS